jgi:hypothetical protein
MRGLKKEGENNMVTENNDWVIDGFQFLDPQDAESARLEHLKIEYLEQHMDMEDAPPEDVMIIYKKAIKDQIFKTPVGLSYLKHLHDYIMMQPEIETKQIPPIPIHSLQQTNTKLYQEETQNQEEDASKTENGKITRLKRAYLLPVMIIVNVMLIFLIGAMFIIAANSNQPNILNYERILQNRYAGWEQSLTQREQELREKELELAK